MTTSDNAHSLTEPDLRPLLGLATTRELLTELEVRMRVTQDSNKGRDLGRLCHEALNNLSKGVLDYRTVAESENAAADCEPAVLAASSNASEDRPSRTDRNDHSLTDVDHTYEQIRGFIGVENWRGVTITNDPFDALKGEAFAIYRRRRVEA